MRVGIRVGIAVGIRVGIRVGTGRTSLSVPVTLGSEASGPSPRLGGPAGTPPFAAGCGLGAGAGDVHAARSARSPYGLGLGP